MYYQFTFKLNLLPPKSEQQHNNLCDKGSSEHVHTYVCKMLSLKAILSKNLKTWLINQKSYVMPLEAAWKDVHLTQVLYLQLQNHGQENCLNILNWNSGSVWTGNPDFFLGKHVTLMDLKFKTLTLKIGGLCAKKREENYKSIPIYNLYWLCSWCG